MESVVEEAFEVQVLQPFHGWVFERFCDRSGNTYPALSEAAVKVDRDDKLNGIEEQEGLEIGVLPSAEWMWSHVWQPDVGYTQCDEEGWSYGSTIARINRRLAEGTSKVKREYYHFLRRRRWIRTRVKKPIAHCDDRTSAMGTNGVDRGSHMTNSSSSVKRYYRVYRDSKLPYFHFSSTPRLSNFIKVEFTDDAILREGWLGLRGVFSRSWKLRYFLLRWDTSSLVCLRDRASLVQIIEEVIDRHTSLLIEESPNKQQFQFLVINGGRKLRLNAVDATSRASWLSAISELIVRSRESFLAGDDSEGNSSTRSRTFRRLRSSFNTDDGSVVDASSTAIHDTMIPNKKKNDKRRWRPYKLISATMHSTRTRDQRCREKYLKKFHFEMKELINIATTFVVQNIDILEENLVAEELFLSSAVTTVPKERIEKLRDKAVKSLHIFEEQAEAILQSSDTNVLTCHKLTKELYLLVKKLQEKILASAPPPTQATIKKVIVESPTKRRIPEDWFVDPTDYGKDRTIQPGSRPSSVHSSRTESSYSSGSSLEVKRRNGRNMSTSEPNRSTPTPIAANRLSISEPIKVKAYVELPPCLCNGHFELPSGVNDLIVKVHDKDLGSFIGFTLCSRAYIEQLESHFGHSVDIAEELRSTTPVVPVASELSAEAEAEATGCLDKRAELYLNKMRSSDLQHTDMKFSYDVGTSSDEFRCVTYFAAQFHALRALTEPGNVEFLNSIVESRRWDTMGGKSGAFFSMTHDKRFVLKGISVTEFNMFVHMAPNYFKFMSHVLATHIPTVIIKIFGLFKLSYSRRLHKQTTYVVVMENLSYGFPPGQMYDIKGILRRRYNVSSSDEEEDRDSFHSVSKVHTTMELPVLLDGNLSERIPIPVSQEGLDIIEDAIQNDTGFLCHSGVIDYSILLLFNEEKREVVVGLIDYLHQFDFLKKMESTSKASLTFRNPTVISPISYRRRFVNAMHRYFVGIELGLEQELLKGKRGYDSRSKEMAVRLDTNTDRDAQADVEAAQLAHNMLHSDGENSRSRPTARSEVAFPRTDMMWSGTRPRGHSMSEVPASHEGGYNSQVEGEECCSTSSDEHFLLGSHPGMNALFHQE